MFRKFIARNIGYPLQDYIEKTDIQGTHKFLKESQYWSEEKMHEYRLEKLQKMISHAYKNVPYYTELFTNNSLTPKDINSFDDLKKIPVLTKELARENQDKLIYKGADFKYVNKNKTGGTTGVPLVVYRDAQDRSYTWGSYYRWYNWMGIEKGDKVITYWGASTVLTQSIENIKKKYSNWLLNNEKINSFNLNVDTVEFEYKKIIKYNPVLIKGYLSAIILIAKYMQENNLSPNKDLKAISTTSETLLPMYRELLQDVFKVDVYDQYGCGEVSAISYECSKHQGLHINEEHVFVETLDANNENLIGESGRVVVTSLNNYVMPFIRYENGDAAVLKKYTCECGVNSLMMHSIDGRTTDTITLRSGNEVHGVFFTDILYEIGVTTDIISRFQVCQKENGHIHVYLESNSIVPIELLHKIKSEISKFIEIDQIEVVNFIPNENSGKFKYIKSEK